MCNIPIDSDDGVSSIASFCKKKKKLFSTLVRFFFFDFNSFMQCLLYSTRQFYVFKRPHFCRRRRCCCRYTPPRIESEIVNYAYDWKIAHTNFTNGCVTIFFLLVVSILHRFFMRFSNQNLNSVSTMCGLGRQVWVIFVAGSMV